MLCPSCGSENQTTAQFCMKCGQRLPDTRAVTSVALKPEVAKAPIAPPVTAPRPVTTTTSVGTTTVVPVHSRLKRCRGMVIVGTMLLLFAFWSPLVACEAGNFGSQTLTGPQLIEAAVQSTSHPASASDDSFNPQLLLLLGIIPLVGLVLLLGTGLALLREAPPRAFAGQGLVGVVASGLVLAGLWIAIKRSNAQLTGTLTANVIHVTGFYWLMWIALVLAGAGCRLEHLLAVRWSTKSLS